MQQSAPFLPIQRRATVEPTRDIARDNRSVVTWTLAAGIASLVYNLSEWKNMQARQSQIIEQALRHRTMSTASGPSGVRHA